MRAVRVEKHGGVEELKLVELPDPQPGPGQVLVRVQAFALNHLDLWVRRGVPGHAFPLPLVPGSDGAGIVEAIGPGVSGIEAGAEVVALPGVSCGRCEACLGGRDQLCPDYGILGESCDGLAAELAVLGAANVARKPRNLPFVEAAAVPLTFQTAWNMLVGRAGLRPGEWVLVQAGGSGVGVAAVQIAKLHGAVVVATAGSDDKCAKLRELGVDHAVNYARQSVPDEVKRLTGKRGVDVAVDHVGQATFADSLRCLGRGGRYVTCGATSGVKAELMLNHVFFKSLSILGSTMGSKGDLLRVLALCEQGKLRPVVGKTLAGLERVGEGHRLLEGRAVFGKVVIKP